MRALRALLVAVIAAGTMTLFAPAGAAADSSNPKFCQALANIDTSNSSNVDDAKATADAFKEAAKTAPAKVKRALKTVSKVLVAISKASDSKDASELASQLRGVQKRSYTNAIKTYVTYYTQTCFGLTTSTTEAQ